MARANRARSGLVIHVPRRLTLWIGDTTAETTLVAANTVVFVRSLNAAALALRPFTIVRVRGLLQIRSDQAASTETQDAAYGMCVVSDQASTIGVTAVPNPIADSASDLFFMYQKMTSQITAGAIGWDADAGHQYAIDSKAMRKVNDDEDVVSVVQNSGISDGSVVTSFGRILVKLH